MFNFRQLATRQKLNAQTFLTRKKLRENFPIYGTFNFSRKTYQPPFHIRSFFEVLFGMTDLWLLCRTSQGALLVPMMIHCCALASFPGHMREEPENETSRAALGMLTLEHSSAISLVGA